MTDEEIIDLFFECSEQAISELAEKHGNAVKRVAFIILGDPEDAKECVNDTWLGAWNSIPPHRPAPLRTYSCSNIRIYNYIRIYSYIRIFPLFLYQGVASGPPVSIVQYGCAELSIGNL